MRKAAAVLALMLVLAVVGPRPLWAGGRVALVIGNGAYKSNPLVNPEYDAMGIGAALWIAGFDVQIGIDLTKPEMEASLREFASLAAYSDIAFLHYSGHGVGIRGENYLLPTDFELTRVEDLPQKATAGSDMMRALNGSKLAILVLDACRDNPFPRPARSASSPVRTVRPEEYSSGLSAMDAKSMRENVLVAFSTGPGQVALDGEGAHSPYSQAIIENIGRNEDVALVFSRVRYAVNASTKRAQLPWGSSYLTGRNVLMLELPESERTARTTVIGQWQLALIDNRAETFEAFAERYPTTPFAPIARKKLASLAAGHASPAEGQRKVALARQFRFQPK